MDRELALRGANFIYTKSFRERIKEDLQNYAAKVSEKMAETFKDPFLAFVETVVKAKGLYEKNEETPAVIQKPQETAQSMPKIEEPTQVFNIQENIDDSKKAVTNDREAKTAILTPKFFDGLKNVFRGKKAAEKKESTMEKPEIKLQEFSPLGQNFSVAENATAQVAEPVMEQAITAQDSVTEEKPVELEGLTPIDPTFDEKLPVGQATSIVSPIVMEQLAPQTIDAKLENEVEASKADTTQTEKFEVPTTIEIAPLQKIEEPDLDFNTIADGISSLVTQNETLKTKLSTVEANAESLLKKIQDQSNQLASLQAKLQKVARENHDMSLELGQVKSERDNAIAENGKIKTAYDVKTAEMEEKVQSERAASATEREKMNEMLVAKDAEYEATIESRIAEGIRKNTSDVDRFRKAAAKVLVEHGVVQNSQPTYSIPNIELEKFRKVA